MKRYRRFEILALALFFGVLAYSLLEPYFSRLFLYSALRSEIRAEIPINFAALSDHPLIQVKIEDSTFNLLFDLGSSAYIKLFPGNINKLKSKSYSGNSRYFDLSGNQHDSPTYLIPRGTIADVEFQEVSVSEESKNQFLSVGVVRTSSENLSPYLKKSLEISDGKIGRHPFLNFDCLIDFPHSKIVLIKPQKKVLEKSLLSAGFTKLPFCLNQYGISIRFMTDRGEVNLILDTGANSCLLKKQVFPFPAEQHIWRTELAAPGIDFGTWHFWLGDVGELYPEFDGLLGVDFFLKNMIYFDFTNRTAYIKKSGL